jgi:hypothetical protein
VNAIMLYKAISSYSFIHALRLGSLKDTSAIAIQLVRSFSGLLAVYWVASQILIALSVLLSPYLH